MHPTFFITALLAIFTSANPVQPRQAGAPTPKTIASDCTTPNPLPSANHTTTGSIYGYMPSARFSTAHLVYSAFFDGYLPRATQFTECLEQCNGFGDPGDCKSALLAYDVPTPAGYYGTTGGVLETACLLYGAYLSPDDFVDAPAKQYVNETAGNIFCPS